MTETAGAQEPVASLRYDGAAERRSIILRLVRERGFRSSSELSQLLGVSEMTVRRDITKLSDAGSVRDVYGGASTALGRDPIQFDDRSAKNAERKTAIAKKAATLIGAGSNVALDSGSTVAAIPRHIDRALELSVITHSLAVVNELINHPNVAVLQLGGQLDRDLLIFVDPDVNRISDNIRVDMLFLGATSVHGDTLYCGNLAEARIKRALAEVADTVIVTCDSSKLELPRTGMARMFGLDRVDTLITDGSASADVVEELRSTGSCEVVLAPVRLSD